jgi:hypothetical protein
MLDEEGVVRLDAIGKLIDLIAVALEQSQKDRAFLLYAMKKSTSIRFLAQYVAIHTTLPSIIDQ